MNREDVMTYVKEKYQTVPEYLWKRSPDSAVFRHQENQKWYGILMYVNRKSLGLPGEGFVDVFDVKCDPEQIGIYRMQTGILPGYHMNKNSWISILLDGTVSDDRIKDLIDESFEMTLNKGSKSKSGKRNTTWLIPSNPKFFDVDAAFKQCDVLEWKQSNHICVGDTIYLYMGAPVSAIRYKCKAIEVDIPYHYEDENLRMFKVMRIQKLQIYDQVPISFEMMKEHGVYAVRGPRSIPESLVQEIEHRYQA